MKKMKMKIIAIAFIAISFCSSLFAQTTKTKGTAKNVKMNAEQRVEQWIGMMSPKLNLTDMQITALKPAMLEREKMRDDLRSKYGKDKKSILAAMKETRGKYVGVLKSTLNPEQLTMLRSLNKEKRNGLKEKKATKTKKATTPSEINEEELLDGEM